MLIYSACQADSDLAMPLLEKIENQTLILQEYTLGDSHCRGLTKAIPLLENKLQKVFFDNCGMTGNQFASIVAALDSLKIFRSIVYRMGQLNA